MSHNSTRWTVEAHHHALRLIGPKREQQSPPPPERRSGDIRSFSRDSRRRLIKKILRLESSRLSAGSFVTLTYHEDWTTDREDIQRDLNAFLQALRREYSSAKYIWRLEFQERGAPHFHLMIWNPRSDGDIPLSDLGEWVRSTWTRIAAQNSEAHAQWGTDTRRISSWREAMSYVSKYIGKCGPEGEIEYSGRRWGASQSLPLSPLQRYHVSERDGQILRRILRKLIAKRLGKNHPLHEHLKRGRKCLIGLEPRTWIDLMAYIQHHGEESIREGPPPDPPSDLPEGSEWVRYTRNPAPEPDDPHRLPAPLLCA